MDRLAKAKRVTSKAVCVSATRGFLKNIIELTPPAHSGVTGNAAKKAGEQTVQNDVLKLVQPVTAEGKDVRSILAPAAEILAAHERSRKGARGRVNPRNRREKLFASNGVVNGVIRLLQKSVGILAAGWVKACAKYKVSMPAWMKRHGAANGAAFETNTLTRFRVTVANEVPFVGDVKDFNRRVEKAVEYQENAMNREADFLLKKAIKEAGF